MSRRGVLGGEHGFTLVELLVTMSLAMVLLFAILGASDLFNKSAVIADKTTAAQDTARMTVREMVHVLRQARSVGTPGSVIGGSPTRSDLVVATYVTSATNPAPGSLPGWVRYCATSSGSLVVGVVASDAYVAPGACAAGDTPGGWHQTVALDRLLQDPTHLFDFTTSACTGGSCPLPNGADVEAVGVRLAIGTGPGADARYSSVVRDAVSFRNRSST